MVTMYMPWRSDGQKTKIIVALALFTTTIHLMCGSHAEGTVDIAALYEQGKAQLNAGDHHNAIRTFSRVLDRIEPHSRNAYAVTYDRAQAYFKKGDLKKAWEDVNAIIPAPVTDGDILAACLNLRAFIHSKRGRERKALQDFTASIKVPHDNQSLRARSFANRGITYINLDLPEKAVSDFNQAIRLEPNLSFAYAGRGLAHLRADEIAHARADSLSALKLSPDEQTRKMAESVLKELTIEASGPLSVTVNVNRMGQIFVPVKFSKRGTPYRFLLDTGASYSLVSRNLMKQIRRETEVTRISQDTVTIADGSRHRVTRYRIGNAFLANLPLGTIEVHVFDSGNNRITNLLGTKSLANIDIHIDNKSGKARISRRGSAHQGL
ncbi:MAG: aspartyl protease family protein [Desulfomonilaceae bacterium]|nr:aspartyl protease family protein [Desulfomonilaceae bacterium]